MDCPICSSVMERQDDLEYNGLHKKMIPSATYHCTQCGGIFYWRLNQLLIHDEDNCIPVDKLILD